jgi:NADPH:quinone reductase-like Zn-dependent oxidoreductase
MWAGTSVCAGTFAVQLAKALAADVTGVCGSGNELVLTG